ALRLNLRSGNHQMVDVAAEYLSRLVLHLGPNTPGPPGVQPHRPLPRPGGPGRDQDQARKAILQEIEHLRPLVDVGQAEMDVPSVALEGGGADLRVPQLALEVLHLAVEGGVHRLVDADPVQQMRPTLQVEAETDRLLPWP